MNSIFSWHMFDFVITFFHTIMTELHDFWSPPEIDVSITPSNWTIIDLDEDPTSWGFDVELDINGTLEITVDENVTTGY